MDQLQDFLKAHAADDIVHQDILDEASGRFNRPPHEVEAASFKANLLPARYRRNRKTLSIDQQSTLFNARAAVIGCGGLGGYVIEELARLGVGTITAVDPDVFEEHNLNRQLYSSPALLGQPKAEAARR